MNGPALQTRIAAELAGIAETLTITRPGASPPTYTAKAVVTLATTAQIGELAGSSVTSRPVFVVTLDGTQPAIAANDSFSRDGRTVLFHTPVTSRIGATVISTVAAAS